MEREEAAASGLTVRSVSEFDFEKLAAAESSPVELYLRFYRTVLDALEVEGSVAFVGDVPVELYGQLLSRLNETGIEIASLDGRNPVERARKRKDRHEIEAIADVGRRTEMVVDSVREVLRECRIEAGRLAHGSSFLRIGDLKAIVRQEIVRHGMVEDHETILAQGRDAAVPHSRGNPDAVVEASSPIVLDIFPCDAGSGYFFDTTRTFCVGDVPQELERLHDLVVEAFTTAAESVRAGTKASSYQHLVCDIFERNGIATIRSQPATVEGYVHGLGHGVGLDVHESPSFSTNPGNDDLIEDGDVITIEPGLYFPSQGIGVRIEDTFVVEDGRARSLCSGARGLRP
jgi:Xaa-Pro aminopeptidase